MIFNVYIYQNKINGKMYVGYTENFKKREAQHKYANIKSSMFHDAIKKYGWDNFKLLSLIELNSYEEMVNKEKEMIKNLGTFGEWGYNLTEGGDGMYLGFHHKEETKKRISTTMLGKQNCLGNILSDEHKQNISNSNKKVIHTEEWNKKVGDAHRGKIVTEETRKRMSKAQTGKVLSQEARDNMSKARTGKKMSEQACINNSLSKMGHIVTEETRQKLREANLGKHHSEETKRKQSESMKKTISLKKLKNKEK